jgi:hypothetical protein
MEIASCRVRQPAETPTLLFDMSRNIIFLLQRGLIQSLTMLQNGLILMNDNRTGFLFTGDHIQSLTACLW